MLPPNFPTDQLDSGSQRPTSCYSFKIPGKSGSLMGMDRLTTDKMGKIQTEKPQQGQGSREETCTEEPRQPAKQKPGQTRGPNERDRMRALTPHEQLTTTLTPYQTKLQSTVDLSTQIQGRAVELNVKSILLSSLRWLQKGLL